MQDQEDFTRIKLELYGYGEWIDEPDFLEFNHKDVNCLIIRNQFGSLCGYCEIPPTHKYFDIKQEDIPCDAYGGITFYGSLENLGIKGKWLGFDCSHSMDISPSSERMLHDIESKGIDFKVHVDQFRRFKRTYKNIDFVIKECQKLADQLIN